jgi:hypothetical protein
LPPISKNVPTPHPSRSLRLHRGHHGTLGESLHDVPRHSPHRSYQEKGGRVATERDEEFERAAWRVMVAAMVEPERLIFVDECGTHTSLSPIYGYAPRGERLYVSVGAAKPRQEHDAALQHDALRDGALAGRGRSDYRPGI